MQPFDDPAPGAAAVEAFVGLLLAARFDVRNVAAPSGFAANDLRVEPFVAAEMLTAAARRTRTADRNAVERGVEELLIVAIRPGDCHA